MNRPYRLINRADPSVLMVAADAAEARQLALAAAWFVAEPLVPVRVGPSSDEEKYTPECGNLYYQYLC